MHYLAYVQTGSSKKYDMSASLKKNAKESVVSGLGTIKKISRAVKLADDINKAQKAAKKVSKGTGKTAQKSGSLKLELLTGTT